MSDIRIFVIEFGDTATTITTSLSQHAEAHVAQHVTVPNELAGTAVWDAQETFTRLGLWATEPERFNGPEWARPTRIDGVECDENVLQLTWTTVRAGLEVAFSAIVPYDDVDEVAELAEEAFDDVNDILDAAQPLLEAA